MIPAVSEGSIFDHGYFWRFINNSNTGAALPTDTAGPEMPTWRYVWRAAPLSFDNGITSATGRGLSMSSCAQTAVR